MSTLFFFFLLWFTGLSFSLRLLHSAILLPGKTLRSVPCLSLYILLSVAHLSSRLTCLLLLFFAMQLLSAQLGRAGDLGKLVSALPGGRSFAWTKTVRIFLQSIFLNTELLVKRGEMMFYHMDDFWAFQRSLFGTERSKSFTLKWARARGGLSHDAVTGAGGSLQIFYKSFYCIRSFPKEAGCLLNRPWYFCECCPKTVM